MDKDEKEARILCAFANWVKECEDCPHREWLDGKWLEKPKFDWRECQEWRYYLPRFKISFLHILKTRIKALIGHG